jgi:CobQ-like glutamine amidotransferase family enzyme
MKIEVLYPEICCLFGDKANMRYFEMCLPQAEFIKTPVSEMPRFLTEDVDMVYFGSCSESNQERILSRLKGKEDRIRELLDKGVIFLMTGNSFEIMGDYIKKPDGEKIDALGIVSFYAERTIPKRNNSLFLGEFGDMEIVGCTSRFSHSYEISEGNAFINVTKGLGANVGCKVEGVKHNNLFGTYLLGPFLVQNPHFTKYLMSLLGVENPTLAFEEDAFKAYEVRLAEYKRDIVFE